MDTYSFPGRRSALGVTFALFAALLAGCDQGPKLVPVTGHVRIDGRPLKYGNIRVVPAMGRTAFSKLDADGRFKLMTDEKEGCVQGVHPVEIGSVESIDEYRNRRYAPEKYDSAANSGLTVDINGPNDNLVIELKNDGKEYPNETSLRR